MRLTFWRRSAETSGRHRNPIFESDTYVDTERVAAGSLHSLSLGLFLYWINACLWAIVDSDLLRIGGSTQGGVILGTLGRIRAALENWCKRECKAGRERTAPGNFTEGMMNSRGAPAKLQGAESNSALVFSHDSLPTRVSPRHHSCRSMFGGLNGCQGNWRGTELHATGVARL